MGTGYQARHAQGTRSDKLRVGNVRHTITLKASLFEAIRTAALAHNRSISQEMVARLGASIDAEGDRPPARRIVLAGPADG